MDAISYSYADKQAKRIKKFINDPDSTSGVLTVPKVIASGENVTIPAGRIAVLPNVQVDGTLNVLGDVFIPAGSTSSNTLTSSTNYTIGGASLSGWSSISVMEGNGGTFFGTNGISAITGSNAYYNGTWNYKTDGSAGLQLVNQGNHQFRVAGAGLANGAITWTTVANIDATGMNALAGTAAVPGYGFLGDTDTGMYGPTANTLGLVTGGSERMRIDAGGNLLVGTSTQTPTNGGMSYNHASGQGNIAIGHINGTPNGNGYQFFYYNGIAIGSITQATTSSIAYNTTSDYRLKENIRPADCKKFMNIKFVDYERIDGRHECGVIAHELQEIYPDLVTGEKDATEIRKVEISPAIEEVKDEEGNIIVEAVEAVYEEQEFPVYQQVNYIGLIARIGTVVQQQAKLIEAMRAEIDELKGAI